MTSQFTTAEDAYQELARSTIDFVRGRPWDVAYCSCKIYSKMASVSHSLERSGVIEEKGLGWPSAGLDPGGAALFLRDNLVKSSGGRIWGLKFALYPNGKFNIEYDYNKPEGYDDSDEVITGEEINASLSNLDEGSDD